MRTVLENEFYYLDNFHRVLEWISERYADLLTAEEHGFIATFNALPQAARALFVRMVMRKGTLFRASKLNYAEIGGTDEAARPLLPTGWVAADPVLTLDELFDLLRKAEIGALFQLSLHEKSARKLAQLDALRSQFADPRPFSDWYRDSGDHVYRILAKPLCDRLRLIFFGNLQQDWTEFVLSDLGVFQYEQVEFSGAARGFRHRRDIDDYLALHACKELFHDGADLDQVLAALPPVVEDNAWLGSRRDRLLFQIAQHVEKQKDWPNAHALYAQCRFPGARGRAIRVLEKDGQYGPAFALFEQAMAAPESDAERQHLSRIGPRLQRRLGHVRATTRRPPSVQRLDLALPQPQTDWWVEGVVRDHLWRSDAPVFYVENALINALFGLLCWRAIFSAIPGAFFHPFHRGPADLHSADFYHRREADFCDCLHELESLAYQETIRTNYAQKHGISSPFLMWEALSEELIELALACIPPQHLKKWCERILLDIKTNRSGFPDLIQFWPAEKRYQMIEVKGPGDRLQDNQLRWIDYCAAHDMPISVCYLQWEVASA
ncbi:MAG: VRR-NUC domain-containing protein [Massilia sp.]